MAYATRPYVTIVGYSRVVQRAVLKSLRWYGRQMGPYFLLKKAVLVSLLSTVYRFFPALVIALIGLLAFQVLFGACLMVARSRLGRA